MKPILKVFVALTFFFLTFPFFSRVTATSSSSSEGTASVDTPTSAPLSAFQDQELKDYNDNLMLTSQPYVTNSSGIIVFMSFSEDKLTIKLTGETGTTSTTIYVAEKGEPTSVIGTTSWIYNASSKILTIIVVHSSPEEVEVLWEVLGGDPSATLIALIQQNYYLVLGLIGLIPIIVGASMIIRVVKGKELLSINEMYAFVAILVTMVLAFIVIITIMNALIGG